MPSQLDEADIFNVARQLDSPSAREQYLSQACGADEAIRAKVSRLLSAYDDQPSFLAAGAGGLAATIDQPTESVGKIIGPYKLLQIIGEGGMGIVYMAEQREPVERKVALKIIKPGMDSRQVIARFEAERQALAMMDHPNIACVLDAGATESGHPYFVMELVKGVPITKYCDEKHLSLKERLELMIPVCQAIQHAHQKGIIHRDIKPTNVLVAQYDGRPVPKVIDFGISKATAKRLTERTMFTELGQLVGTLEYMSPEQAELNQLDIDTRSDIYSLGVLLYELLTGSTPFDKQILRAAAFQEMLRIIREDEPEKPSTRLSRVRETHQPSRVGSAHQNPLPLGEGGRRPGEGLPQSTSLISIAANRNIEPARMSKLLLGELDWIVMKALEKDRNRRYETANGLAADIQRFLGDEQVQACPPSAGYRFRKFARRNKVALTTAALIALSLIAGTAVSTWQAIEANLARRLADERLVLANNRLASEQQARQEADSQRLRADSERQNAEANFQKALQAVDRMLTRVGDDSIRNIPQMEQVQKRLLQDAVEFYEGFLRERSGDRQVRYEAAQSYMRLVGAFWSFRQTDDKQKALQLAKDLFSQLHAENPDDVDITLGLSRTYMWIGWDSTEGPSTQEGYFRHAHELLVGAERGIPTDRLVEFRNLLGQSYANLGAAIASQGRYAESESLFNKALALGEGHHELAVMLVKVNRLPEAIDYMQQAVQARHKQIESSSKLKTIYQYKYAECSHALGEVLMGAKRTEAALTHLQTAFAIRKQLVSDFPTATLYKARLTDSRVTLIRAYRELGKSAEALEIINELDPHTGDEYAARAKLYEELGDTTSALGDLEKALRFDSPHTERRSHWASDLYFYRARFLMTEKKYEQALADSSRAVELDPANIHRVIQRGEALLGIQEFSRALLDFDAAIQRLPNAWTLYKRRALAHFHLGHFDHALADIAKAVELDVTDSSNLFWIPPSLVAACPNENFRAGMLALADKTVELTGGAVGAFASRGQLYAAQKDWDKARADFDRALTIKPDHARTLAALEQLKVEQARNCGGQRLTQPEGAPNQ